MASISWSSSQSARGPQKPPGRFLRICQHVGLSFYFNLNILQTRFSRVTGWNCAFQFYWFFKKKIKIDGFWLFYPLFSLILVLSGPEKNCSTKCFLLENHESVKMCSNETFKFSKKIAKIPQNANFWFSVTRENLVRNTFHIEWWHVEKFLSRFSRVTENQKWLF